MDLLQIVTFASIIGLLTLIMGITVKVIGLPDQIRKNHKRKSTEGLSTLFMVMTFVAYLLWTVHGIFRNDPVLIYGQGVGILTSGIILGQIFIYRKKDGK